MLLWLVLTGGAVGQSWQWGPVVTGNYTWVTVKAMSSFVHDQYARPLPGYGIGLRAKTTWAEKWHLQPTLMYERLRNHYDPAVQLYDGTGQANFSINLRSVRHAVQGSLLLMYGKRWRVGAGLSAYGTLFARLKSKPGVLRSQQGAVLLHNDQIVTRNYFFRATTLAVPLVASVELTERLQVQGRFSKGLVSRISDRRSYFREVENTFALELTYWFGASAAGE